MLLQIEDAERLDRMVSQYGPSILLSYISGIIGTIAMMEQVKGNKEHSAKVRRYSVAVYQLALRGLFLGRGESKK